MGSGRENGVMSTTIDLPADLVRELERRAADRGQDLNETIAELLRTGLGAPQSESGLPRSTIKTHRKTGLPYIECLHPAKDLTPQRVADILLEQEVARHDEAR
jgi:hypothetical protein